MKKLLSSLVPTGKRYCMNGVAMTFKPGAAAS
jgi:peptide methionine sulfoxide reductase MsrB